MRLNRWQRFGIILSIGWAVVAAIYEHNAYVQRAHESPNFLYNVCIRSSSVVLGLPPANDSELARCAREREKNLAVQLEGTWIAVALMALVPLPVGWFAAYILAAVGRGAVIGFRAVVPWATITWPRRLFVVSALASIAAVGLGIGVELMGRYVDLQVPVYLYPFSDFSQNEWESSSLSGETLVRTPEGRVSVQGTWTRDGIEGGIIDPLQTSQINCDRRAGRCREAKASVSVGSVNLLNAELIEYEIASWSPTTVVFKLDDPSHCVVETFTIDLLTKSVNGIGRVTKDATYNINCKYAKEENWNYHLVNGSTVDQEQRKKARPYPHRLLQALFGH